MFKMIQNEDRSLEEFVERILFDLQRYDHADIGKDVLKIILLCGFREDCLDMLNLLGRGDISREYFDPILDLC